MKKVLLVVAILMLAMPAWAEVQIIVTPTDPCTFEVKFEAGSEPNRVRAFGLDIILDDANIIDVCDYKIGESVVGDKGYGIFPGSIDINVATGLVDANGTPDCNGNVYPLPGTQPGLDTNAVTFELGSLYVGGPNAPDTNGLLFKFLTDLPITPADVCIMGNAARTGSGSGGIGVVMERPGEIPDVNFIVESGDCYTGPNTVQWALVGKPDCWCYVRQCHGDADNFLEGSAYGGYWWVGGFDLQILAAAYNQDIRPNPQTPRQVGDLPAGPPHSPPPTPPPPSNVPGICADFNHKEQGSPYGGYWRVGGLDLQVLAAYYKGGGTGQPNPVPNADCLTADPCSP